MKHTNGILPLAVLVVAGALWTSTAQAGVGVTLGVQGYSGYHYPYAYDPFFTGYRTPYGYRYGRGFGPGYYHPRAYGYYPYHFQPREVQVRQAYTQRSSTQVWAAETERAPHPVANYVVEPSLVSRSAPVSTPLIKSGWTWLAEEAFEQAGQVFGAEVAANPRSGPPHVGFSIVAAQLGDYSQAANEMKRAFMHDPKGALFIPATPAVRKQIDLLARDYQRLIDKYPRDAESEFMLAALSLLNSDHKTAETYVKSLKLHGDETVAVKNLDETLAEQVKQAEMLDVSGEGAIEVQVMERPELGGDEPAKP